LEEVVIMKKNFESVILAEDLDRIIAGLSDRERALLRGSTVLMTGCGGFLGYLFTHLFVGRASQLGIRRVIGLENFLTGKREWLQALAERHDHFRLVEFNVITDSIEDVANAAEADWVLHMASIASPTYYRKYPLETIDANVGGLRKMLDFYRNRPVKGVLFFSSSEIYGDPVPAAIPTQESYRGNVSTIGPRSCYDEAKRFGETLCYVMAEQFKLPARAVRPFNNFGPGMDLNDKRLPADLANAIREGRDIELLSNGSPTRTYCYVSDAITGYLKVMMHSEFDVFNIGNDSPEISVREFAERMCQSGRDVFGYTGSVIAGESKDVHYLTDNPQRRCPDLAHARKVLGYAPQVGVDEGILRYLKFVKETKGTLV
jgi:UDP-glucuronate decarboxylase